MDLKDIVIRAGGDEFIVVAHNTDEENLSNRLQAIDEDTFIKLLNEADKAMYNHKAMRKNSI